MEKKLGPPAGDGGGGVGTYAEGEWPGLCDGRLTVRAIWQEDDGVAYVEYVYNPVYKKYVESLRRQSDAPKEQ